MTHLNYPNFIIEDGSERPAKNYGKVKRVLVPVALFTTLYEEALDKESKYLNFKPYLKNMDKMLEHDEQHPLFTADKLLADYVKLCGTDFSEAVVRRVRMPLSVAYRLEQLAKRLEIPEANVALYLFALIHYFRGGYGE